MDAAPLTCAGVTTYKALKVAHPQPSETVMVVGIGGLGHLGLQYAQGVRKYTVAVDVEDEKLQLAKDLGADHVLDARGDRLEAIADIGGVDVALVTVPVPAAMQTAHAALNPNGRMVLVGLPANDRLELPIFDTVLTGKSVIGSLVGTRNDLADCFALHARGLTKVVAERRQLEDVNDCFEEVLAGPRSGPARFRHELSRTTADGLTQGDGSGGGQDGDLQHDAQTDHHSQMLVRGDLLRVTGLAPRNRSSQTARGSRPAANDPPRYVGLTGCWRICPCVPRDATTGE